MAGIADPPDRPEHGRAAGPAARRDPSRRDDAGDTRLVQRIVSGDSTALGELYDRFGRQAYSLARRICADEGLAEDVVQEVFLAFWRDPSRFDPAKGRFGTWLLTLVHHKSVDAVRRESAIRRRTVPASDDGAEWNAPPGPGADEGAIGALVAGQVRDALGRHEGLSVDTAALDRPGIDPDWRTDEGGLRLRPDYWADKGGMDGFYIACLVKA